MNLTPALNWTWLLFLEIAGILSKAEKKYYVLLYPYHPQPSCNLLHTFHKSLLMRCYLLLPGYQTIYHSPPCPIFPGFSPLPHHSLFHPFHLHISLYNSKATAFMYSLHYSFNFIATMVGLHTAARWSWCAQPASCIQYSTTALSLWSLKAFGI